MRRLISVAVIRGGTAVRRRVSSGILAVWLLGLVAAACTPTTTATPAAEACTFTANADLTVYRLPDSTSDVFGTMLLGESYQALARTADGWIGFDPGIAQAGNVGLAHHRWVFDFTAVTPSCLSAVELVTLAEVQADLDASG